MFDDLTPQNWIGLVRVCMRTASRYGNGEQLLRAGGRAVYTMADEQIAALPQHQPIFAVRSRFVAAEEHH